jgi:cystathionine beta-lyase
MNEFIFEKETVRTGTGNLKGLLRAELEEKGIQDPVILFGAEMDYPTAPCISKRLESFAREGLYGFTMPDEPYLSALCRWMKNVRGMEIQPEWILPVQGTTFALSTCIRALTKPEEKVLLLSPSYYRFDRAVIRNERNVFYHSLLLKDDHYEIGWEDLETKLSDPSCSLMVLVNPHNPTGKVFASDDLQRISHLCCKHKVTVFSDEIFAETVQAGFSSISFASIDPKSITCTSLGKAFNLTGVNQANLIIPDDDLRAVILHQRDVDHFGSIDPFFYQALLAAYTPEGAEWLQAMNAHTAENVRMIRAFLNQNIPDINLLPVEGTFIGWLDCRSLGMTDEQLQQFFENAGIFANPGVEYGPDGSGFYRWNLATSHANIQKALSRLKEAYDKL